MKMKVSDYIADFFVKKGITHVFGVVGGGAMHLNDSFGHHPQMHCTYNHHEQASAMAAEAYARIAGKPAIVCVTSGPGAINALNGVAGAYQDSIPMLIVSGQMKTANLVRTSGLDLRTLGGQEFDITHAVGDMTKYAELVLDPQRIAFVLEKAYAIATTGRQGPCWVDVPVDIQGKSIETDDLQHYRLPVYPEADYTKLAASVADGLMHAERPVIYAGNGIRWAGAAELLPALAKRYGASVVTCWDSIDLMATDSRYYCGRGGTMGDRAGNFAVQNSDYLLCLGARGSTYRGGCEVHTGARSAYVVDVDIDHEELRKKIIHVDLPLCGDAGAFMKALLAADGAAKRHDVWINQCNAWKKTYPVVQQRQYEETEKANVYAFIDTLSRMLPEDNITVVTNGSASVVGSQTYYIKQGDRFLMNCGISSMGYGLPASVGASIAAGNGDVVCIEGDGSIMMNLQELQTIVTNELPVKIFIINNEGYHQPRQTERNFFVGKLVGVGPESGDLGFPDYGKVATAFGMPYVRIGSNAELEDGIAKTLATERYAICEVFVTTTQKFEPKNLAKKLPDGTIVSPPLEDMAPFLPREELAKNMFVPLVDE